MLEKFNLSKTCSVEMPHNGLQTIDRRKDSRKKLEVLLILNPLNTADFHPGQIQDISMGGIRVNSGIQSTHLAKEEEVTVLANADYFFFEARGKVIWTSDVKGEVGIKFTQLAEKTRNFLEEFLKLFP